MSWLQIHFQLPGEVLEQVEEFLEALGALSVTLRDAEDEPLFEPPPGTLPMWGEVRIQALFAADTDAEALRQALTHQMGQPPAQWRTEMLEDQAWERTWMEQFEPMQFGKRLWIVPSWHEPPDPQAINLMLDPGLAFGTGTHPTTALCLEWLDAHPPQGKTVLDFGCGSGVLALAAARLAADRVTGVDIDSQALLASRENFQRNRVNDDSLTLLFPEDLPEASRFDLVIANILAGPLMELAGKLTSHLRLGGEIILSGILEEQSQVVVAAYEPEVQFAETRSREGWVCLHGKRK
jgi:ribosomal protein L11 methyltransferase